jgi:hypothetical protein
MIASNPCPWMKLLSMMNYPHWLDEFHVCIMSKCKWHDKLESELKLQPNPKLILYMV